MPDNPATILRQAAKKLRVAAAAPYVQPGPWIVHEAYGFLRVDNDRDKTHESWTIKSGADLAEENRDTAEYIALMHPGVGLALADWLQQAAGDFEMCERINSRDPYNDGKTRVMPHHLATAALAVARQVLGVAE